MTDDLNDGRSQESPLLHDFDLTGALPFDQDARGGVPMVAPGVLSEEQPFLYIGRGLTLKDFASYVTDYDFGAIPPDAQFRASERDKVAFLWYNRTNMQKPARCSYQPQAWPILKWSTDMDIIPHASGIYQILCTRTKKVYIGSAADLYQRRHNHWSQLKLGKHINSYLQRAWNKYGERAFVFTVLQLAPANQLSDFEQWWIDCKQSTDPNYGYNLAPAAGSNLGYKHGPLMKQRLSEHRAQQWDGFVDPDGNDISITNLWAFCKRMGLHFGAMHNLAAGRGRTKSYKGWTHRDNPKPVTELKSYDGFIDPDGNPIEPIIGLPEFCRQRGLSPGHMHDVYTGKRRIHRGWTCKRRTDE